MNQARSNPGTASTNTLTKAQSELLFPAIYIQPHISQSSQSKSLPTFNPTQSSVSVQMLRRRNVTSTLQLLGRSMPRWSYFSAPCFPNGFHLLSVPCTFGDDVFASKASLPTCFPRWPWQAALPAQLRSPEPPGLHTLLVLR